MVYRLFFLGRLVRKRFLLGRLVLLGLQIAFRSLSDISLQRVFAGQRAGNIPALGLVKRLRLCGVGHAVRDGLRAKLRNEFHDGFDRGRGPIGLAQVSDDLLAEHHVIHGEIGELHQRGIVAAETGEQEVEAPVPQIGNGSGVVDVSLRQQLGRQFEAHAVGVDAHGLHAPDELGFGALFQQEADGHVDRDPLEEEVSVAEGLFRLQTLGQLEIEEREALVGELRHLAEVFRDQRPEARRVQPGPGLEEDHASGLDLADPAVEHFHRAQSADVLLQLLRVVDVELHRSHLRPGHSDPSPPKRKAKRID